jgi:hypothetical protein
MAFYVYILCRDEDFSTPFYVGQGKGGRWLRHEREVLDGRNACNPYKANTIRKVHAQLGYLPKVKIADGLTERLAFALEKALIAKCQYAGINLTNLTPGGKGGVTEAARAVNKGRRCSEETRAKIGAARKGHRHSEEVRAKISAAHKGRTLSEERRAKLRGRVLSEERRAKLRGRVLSEETRAKISAATRGRRFSEETRAKLSAAARTRGISEETRAKISAAKKGYRHSEETRSRMSAAHKGRPRSEETRAKISAAQKGRRRKSIQTIAIAG